MLTSRELLAAVRAAQGIESNYRLARVLDVPEKTVQRWNTCRNTPDDAMTLRLAQLAGINEAEALASMYAQRATSGPLRDVWERIAKVATAAAVALLLGFWTGGPDAGAMARQLEPLKPAGNLSPTAADTQAGNWLCIMSTAARAVFRSLRRWFQAGPWNTPLVAVAP